MTLPHPHLSLIPGTSAAPVAITVPAQPWEISGIRKAVGALAASAGLGADRRADVALAVGEACANAVVHAYVDREPGLLRVTATLTALGLEVIVADDGRGLTPRSDSPGLGLGLPLMAAIATSLEFRVGPSGGTEISMVFATDGAHAAAPGWSRTG